MNDRDLSPILGCLMGTALGDALGLPTEGLSRKRAERACAFGLRHRLLFGRGMLSDDTEHTLLVAAAWLKHPDDAVAFQRSLGWALRWWLLALPAGAGLSTIKAISRLWLGFPTSKAGVRSAGNGAAMRSAILGVIFMRDAAQRQEFTLAACRLTHTDARAEESAFLVAEAAALAALGTDSRDVLVGLKHFVRSDEMSSRWDALESALDRGLTVWEYAAAIGCEHGVSGFAPNTVAVALYAWLRHRGHFEEILTEIVRCGGDTDSVASIAGGISGAEVTEHAMPQAWIAGLVDWPRSVKYIRELARALSDGSACAAPKLWWPLVLGRNIFFLSVVLVHGVGRMLPRSTTSR